MKHKRLTRLISMLLVVATLIGLLAVPASAASLANSGSVKITMNGFGNYLSKKSGGTIGGGYWQYTSKPWRLSMTAGWKERRPLKKTASRKKPSTARNISPG